MSDLKKLQELVNDARSMIETLSKDAYTQAGASSTASFSDQVGSPSAEVLLTDGYKKKKKLKKSVADAPDFDVEGITTTINGKRLKVTGFSPKKEDEYLFGDTKIEKVDEFTIAEANEILDILLAPEVDDSEDLSKCDVEGSALIKGKKGKWRRIAGRPCYICKEGVIHAGPKNFIGKKAASLRDELRRDRRTSKFKKRFSTKSE